MSSAEVKIVWRQGEVWRQGRYVALVSFARAGDADLLVLGCSFVAAPTASLLFRGARREVAKIHYVFEMIFRR